MLGTSDVVSRRIWPELARNQSQGQPQPITGGRGGGHLALGLAEGQPHTRQDDGQEAHPQVELLLICTNVAEAVEELRGPDVGLLARHLRLLREKPAAESRFAEQ